MKNLLKAVTVKAQFTRAKEALKVAGIDVGDVKKITDLPKVLQGMVPESMVQQAQAIVENQEAVAALLKAFTGVAASGGIMDVLYGGASDEVKEGDVHA